MSSTSNHFAAQFRERNKNSRTYVQNYSREESVVSNKSGSKSIITKGDTGSVIDQAKKMLNDPKIGFQ
jgi:hypothetical protein